MMGKNLIVFWRTAVVQVRAPDGCPFEVRKITSLPFIKVALNQDCPFTADVQFQNIKPYGPVIIRPISQLPLITAQGRGFQFLSRPPIPDKTKGVPRMSRSTSAAATGNCSCQYISGANITLAFAFGYTRPPGQIRAPRYQVTI